MTRIFTPIYTIQGSGLATTMPGTVTTEGVVVGDFEGTAAASGFYIQDLTGDGNAATSDGIFVFTGNTNLASVGDVVRVTGFARERFNQTTLNGSNSNTASRDEYRQLWYGLCSGNRCDIAFRRLRISRNAMKACWFASRSRWSLLNTSTMTALARWSLPCLSAGESRPFTGTAIDEPGAAANARTAANSLEPHHAGRCAERPEPTRFASPERSSILADQPLPRW